METKKVLLTGGGTAGHVTPNMALVPELKKLYKKATKMVTEYKGEIPETKSQIVTLLNIELSISHALMIDFLFQTYRLLGRVRANYSGASVPLYDVV